MEALNQNKTEEAKMYAETVIRQRNEAIHVRRFGIKMQALSSKIESAYRTQQMSQTMKSTIPILTKAMKKMDANGVSTLFYLLLNECTISDWTRRQQIREDFRGHGGQDR